MGVVCRITSMPDSWGPDMMVPEDLVGLPTSTEQDVYVCVGLHQTNHPPSEPTTHSLSAETERECGGAHERPRNETGRPLFFPEGNVQNGHHVCSACLGHGCCRVFRVFVF